MDKVSHICAFRERREQKAWMPLKSEASLGEIESTHGMGKSYIVTIVVMLGIMPAKISLDENDTECYKWALMKHYGAVDLRVIATQLKAQDLITLTCAALV
eukprot:988645-Ditylum_brightwellii.AAC.1